MIPLLQAFNYCDFRNELCVKEHMLFQDILSSANKERERERERERESSVGCYLWFSWVRLPACKNDCFYRFL